MVTTAKVLSVISNEEVKVQIDAYDEYEDDPNTSEDDLSNTHTARVSSVPGFIPDFKVGDIVFVCIKDNRLDEPIVMGKHLLDECKENTVGTSRATLSKLVVNDAVRLCEDTEIGDVKKEQISYLKGAKSNIQAQLDTQLNQRETLLSKLTTKLTTFTDKMNLLATGGQ